MFGGREDRVGAGERHDSERVGIRNVFARRPFGDERGDPVVGVVMAQEHRVDVEPVPEIAETRAVGGRGGGGVRPDEVGGDAGDQHVEARRQLHRRCLLAGRQRIRHGAFGNRCSPVPA